MRPLVCVCGSTVGGTVRLAEMLVPSVVTSQAVAEVPLVHVALVREGVDWCCWRTEGSVHDTFVASSTHVCARYSVFDSCAFVGLWAIRGAEFRF